jgi:hypothetical protein
MPRVKRSQPDPLDIKRRKAARALDEAGEPKLFDPSVPVIESKRRDRLAWLRRRAS